MKETTVFEVMNPHGAGIDVGSEKVFVSIDGSTVVNFETFTADYKRCVNYLKENGISQVAMEATGVYWIAFHEMLEQAGIQVCLVNPKEVKQVKGRKTDVKDCQWIQKLFSAGLLRQSYIPAGKFKELRMLNREREDIIEMGSAYINKMQKALELMNIKLTGVISQINGVSGIKMISAILNGERDPHKLLALCDKRIIKAKADRVLKALKGNYTDTYLFLLKASFEMWKYHEQHVHIIDKKLQELLEALTKDLKEVHCDMAPKLIRHHKPQIKDLHQKLLTLYGTNVSTVSGLTDYTLLKLVGETGNDLSRFPTVKHFVSWCQLSPRSSQSGKQKRPIRVKNKSKAGQIFREAAQSLIQSKNIAIGMFMRRIRSRKGPAAAIKAGARKLACAYYNTITKGANYVEEGVKAYELKFKAQEIRLLHKLAAKHKIQLIAS